MLVSYGVLWSAVVYSGTCVHPLVYMNGHSAHTVNFVYTCTCACLCVQSLCCLVRDWSYPYDHEFGENGGRKYLDKVLEARTLCTTHCTFLILSHSLSLSLIELCLSLSSLLPLSSSLSLSLLPFSLPLPPGERKPA